MLSLVFVLHIYEESFLKNTHAKFIILRRITPYGSQMLETL